MPCQANKKVRQAVTNQIVDALRAGQVVPWRSPWVGQPRLLQGEENAHDGEKEPPELSPWGFQGGKADFDENGVLTMVTSGGGVLSNAVA